MTRSELISDAEVVTGAGVVDKGWILVEDGVITGVGPDDNRPSPARANTTLSGAFVLPGFVDIHVHGGGGGTFGSDLASAHQAARFHASSGTTSLLATISTCAARRPVGPRKATGQLGRRT